jgi:hypothetical protein
MPVLTSASTSAASATGLAQVRPLINTSEAFQRPAIGLGHTEFLEGRNKSSQSSRSPHPSSSIKGKSYNIGLSGMGGASVARDASGGLVGGGIIVDSLS